MGRFPLGPKHIKHLRETVNEVRRQQRKEPLSELHFGDFDSGEPGGVPTVQMFGKPNRRKRLGYIKHVHPNQLGLESVIFPLEEDEEEE